VLKICTECNEEFELKPNKPGLIHHCPDCSQETVERLGGNMTWDHKTAPTLEIKSISDAQVFAAKQRRFGAGVTCCLTTSKVVANLQLTGVK